ncbi:histidine kinase dimerization/phosphoacceptor domain -containing protein [Sphingomonas abaci]|uniref:Light-regulated signal transduction histidine kinase (Bacteriophytochrome) n=1 Tax=Sphingomonas abaci TaxID=237611 RepID=A0A7W7F1P4_9SPHN|nr:histidine kinase dimerization/phosphoacceptor domain -containing protein [Sphingomonas abaci]MBB4619580.1 light-regulated signal transduction histidine kinase (bacteriophytochrome) [Sphingomonas abaci]
MASHLLSTDPGADLSACDREPIHIPGSIQPHGLLLVAEAASGLVVAGAGPLEAVLAADWLGRSLADLLGQDVQGRFDPMPVGSNTLPGMPVTGRDGRRYDVALHRAGDRLLVELERAADAPLSSGEMLALLENFAIGFERAGDLNALCARAATAFRALTGFDRVMVYRFLDDDAGRVVAEDSDPTLSSFLHHHFPASDIPRQARALYVRNRARVIPDVDYEAAPIRPVAWQDSDLSDVAVRSVSPIHLRYLRNMGVQASASISIVKGGLLWGLIACHHRTPHSLPADIRAGATVLASSLSRQIRAKEEAETYRERLGLRGLEDAIAPRLATATSLAEAVSQTRRELRELLGGDGLAFVDGATVLVRDGRCPPDDFTLGLVEWLRQEGGVEPFSSHMLSAAFPPAAARFAEASGLLALPQAEGRGMLLWFRAEQPEEIEWAGNPHKSVALTHGETLTPRASFETWREEVRGRSRHWTLEEIESARRLGRTLLDADRNRRLRDLNGELNRTVAAKDVLLQQKDLLMKEVDHRIQNSLQLVAAFLSMQARAAGPGAVADQLGEAQARLAAVAQVHRRLYRDDQIETIDLSRYLTELTADMKATLGEGWARQMTLDLAPVLIPTDRAVKVGLILTELVINATKYAYPGTMGPIAIALERHHSRLRLIVADEGNGKPAAGGSGFGSRMMLAMVQQLGGVLEMEDNAPGLRVVMTAPIAG